MYTFVGCVIFWNWANQLGWIFLAFGIQRKPKSLPRPTSDRVNSSQQTLYTTRLLLMSSILSIFPLLFLLPSSFLTVPIWVGGWWECASLKPLGIWSSLPFSFSCVDSNENSVHFLALLLLLALVPSSLWDRFGVRSRSRWFEVLPEGWGVVVAAAQEQPHIQSYCVGETRDVEWKPGLLFLGRCNLWLYWSCCRTWSQHGIHFWRV